MGGWKYGQKDGLRSELHQPMGPVRSGYSLRIGPLMHVPGSRPDDKSLRPPITVLGAFPFVGLWECGCGGVETVPFSLSLVRSFNLWTCSFDLKLFRTVCLLCACVCVSLAHRNCVKIVNNL